MSLYGYHRQTTPNLDELASHCTVYRRCFAPSCWTIPSHASLFTGLYPSQHQAFEGNYLHDGVQHLVSAVKMMGYETFGISANRLVSPATGLCRDFDHFKNFDRVLTKYKKEASEISKLVIKGKNRKEQLRILWDYIIETSNYQELGKFLRTKVDTLIDKIIEYVTPNPIRRSVSFTENTVKLFSQIVNRRAANDKPFFIFINFLETHERFRPPLKWRKFSKWSDRQPIRLAKLYHPQYDSKKDEYLKTIINLYDDEIVYLDRKIREVFETIDNSPFSENTVIILTSDHGEHFGEKGLYTHLLSLYNELIWIPLIVRYPPGWARQGETDRLVSLTDMYATVLDMMSCPLPKPHTSLSLLDSDQHDWVLSQYILPERFRECRIKKAAIEEKGGHYSPPVLAVMTAGGKKLIENRDGSLEVYDLRRDPNEDHNLVPVLSEDIIKEYRGLLEYLKESTGFIETMDFIKQNYNLDSIAAGTSLL